MVYRGRVKNGVIVLDEPGNLPDGAEVEVSPVGEEEQIPTVFERYQGMIGIAEGLPADSSINHDHYLYGAPRR